jgi:hypothetical protein
MVPLDQGVGVKARLWGGRALAVVVTLAFLGSALSKLVHVAKVVEGLTKSGIPQGAIVPIGLLEIACLALYLFPRTSILGTFLLTGYIGGAIVTHIIGRQSLVPPLIVGFLMFAAAYLRNPDLQDVVPFHSTKNSAAKVTQSAVPASN